MISKSDAVRSLAREALLLPQEEMLETGRKQRSLFIGIPKETGFQENRIALTPDGVTLLINNGHRVMVETGAGVKSNYSDRDYSEAGAEIAYDKNEVFRADILLKVAPPSEEEIELMQPKQTLFSALQLSVAPRDFLKKLMDKRVTAIAWDFIQDEEGIYTVIRCMGEIAGNTSILIAAEYLSNVNNGKGLMLGGIAGTPPTEVVILGAGTVGEVAARSALGLGASVKIFDNSIYRLRRIQNDLGLRVYTSLLQPTVLEGALKEADVVIGAIRSRNGRTPCVVTENMVRGMKDGSVIVDVSIDQGGCFETSRVTNHDQPVFTEHGVIHYCVPNIASRVSRTASMALNNVFSPIILQMGDEGGSENLIKRHFGFRHGVYLFNGTLTSPILGEAFKLPYKDIELLIAAF
jgi:alanine dehydrogenase